MKGSDLSWYNTHMTSPSNIPILYFKTQNEWQEWLNTNHTSTGIWLRFYKKASGIATVTYAEALEVALCYGWIDGQVKKYDDQSYLQRFTPRRPKSIWSKINTQHVERLIKEGKMKPSGLKAVENAKADGRWQQAYDSPSTMKIPEDFLTELSKSTKAKAFFDTLSKSNIYAIAYRLQTAKKPETRERRKRQLLEMLAKGEKLY